MGKVIYWTETEDKLLRDKYYDLSERQLAALLGRSRCAIRGRIGKLKLKLPREIYEQRQKSQWFSKDHVGFRPQKGVHLAPETEFKKGHLPANMKFDGCISVRRNNPRGTAYKYIRIAQGKWKQLHQVIWEKKHGEIPVGKILIFKNGDSMDVRLGNLKLITRLQHLNRNKPADIHTNMEYRHRSDKWVVSYLTRDPELRRDILKNHPELIEIKRKQLELRRVINAA